jgi:hypothetical protein
MAPFQKKFCTLLTILLTFLIFSSLPAFAFQNEPDGFRGIKWGTNINALPDMGLIDSDGETKFYIRRNDKMKIGDADVDKIVYGFYKTRFFYVRIKFNNFSNFTRLKETLFSQYGQGDKPNQFMEKYFWHGAAVSISFNYNEIGKKGEIYYFFIPVSDEERKDEEERAKKGAKDL